MTAPKADDRPGGARTPGIPSFGVRFESPDEFLAEYADHLRHGVLQLSLRPPPPPASVVRVRVRLPDAQTLDFTGCVLDTDRRGTRIQLDPLSDIQRTSLEQCAADLLRRRDAATSTRAQELPLAVLLVDDSVTQRIELGDALRARGLRVRVAENGLVALSGALKRPPDIILTDVEMPQMDGWSLLRAVRQRQHLHHVPVVFLTRLSDDLSRLRGYRMGVDDYLGKLTPPDEIVARLRGAVARRRQLSSPPTEGGRSLRGNLEHVRLGSLLAILETEGRTGRLVLRNGNDEATLVLRQGGLASVADARGREDTYERALQLLEWRTGHFEFFAPDAAIEAESTTSATSVSFLLMEHARRAEQSDPTSPS